MVRRQWRLREGSRRAAFYHFFLSLLILWETFGAAQLYSQYSSSLLCSLHDLAEATKVSRSGALFQLATSSCFSSFSAFHDTAAQECLDLLTPTALSPRRGSGLFVSSNTANTAACQPRKFSFPAALPSGLLGLESAGMGFLARRRFSNVSDAVTRKLSHTIGWRTSHSHSREVVAVGKSLCTQYIRSRLKRGGHLNKKCALQRLRSAVALPGGLLFREVYPELLGLGMELERLHPRLYVNVTRQASSAPGGKLTSEKDPGNILTAVSRELLKNELTWSKIVSLYAVAGGLAVDCVRQGHYDYLSSIVEAMEEILEEELAHWIQYKGGWYALSALVKPPTSKWPSAKIFVLVSSFFITVFVIVLTLRLSGISAFV